MNEDPREGAPAGPRPAETGGSQAADGPFAFLSRRRFLRWSLGGAAALTGAGAAVATWVRGPAPDVAGLRALGDAQYRTLTHLVDATFAGAPVDLAALDLPRAFDAFLATEHPGNVRDLERAILLVELAPLVLDGLGTTFSRLGPTERLDYWRTWPTSERLVQRQVSIAFRKFFNMVFYDHESVWPLIGYPGPSVWELMGGRPAADRPP